MRPGTGIIATDWLAPLSSRWLAAPRNNFFELKNFFIIHFHFFLFAFFSVSGLLLQLLHNALFRHESIVCHTSKYVAPGRLDVMV